MVEVDKLRHMVEHLRLDGRVVIVTGASRGIGAAVARLAAGLGAHVVGVARSADAIRSVLGSAWRRSGSDEDSGLPGRGLKRGGR